MGKKHKKNKITQMAVVGPLITPQRGHIEQSGYLQDALAISFYDQYRNMLPQQSMFSITAPDPYGGSLPNTIRLIAAHFMLRNISKAMVEYNPYAAAAVKGLVHHVVSTGFSIEVAPIKGVKAEAEQKAAQQIVDEISEFNCLNEMVPESLIRTTVEGNCFIRLKDWDSELPTRLHFQEPDQFWPPTFENNMFGRWGFGIENPSMRETDVVLGYHVRYPWLEEEDIPEADIVHIKPPYQRKNQKLGISELFPALSNLDGVNDLTYKTRMGASNRAAISFIRQWTVSDKTAMEKALGELPDGPMIGRVEPQSGNFSYTTTKRTDAGTVVDAIKEVEVKDPPKSNIDDIVDISSVSLEAAAAALGLPVWVISGKAAESSYSSSAITETSIILGIIFRQAHLCRKWKEVFRRCLTIASEQGRISRDWNRKLRLVVRGPTPTTRNLLEETNALQTMIDGGRLDRRTANILQNMPDLDEVKENRKADGDDEMLPAESNPKAARETMGGERQAVEETVQ